MFSRIAQRKRPRRPAYLLLVAATVASLLFSAVALALVVEDSGSYSVIVENDGSSSGLVDIGTASVEYIGSDAEDESSGTGLFDPFVRLQGAPTEEGYNTNGTPEFQTKTGKWTHAIPVAAIPIVDCDGEEGSGTATCWELFVDINESNNAKYVSLNEVEIWFTDSATLTGYPFTTSATTFQVYDFTGEILIHDVNSGSGRGDLRYLIPIATITPWTTEWFVLYSEWGTSEGDTPTDNKGYGSEGGFEEWKVRKAANVGILKTANPPGPVNAGTAIGFDITVTNSGAADATNVTITDDLPAGGGLFWSLDPAFSGCLITGLIGDQTLNCTFATLAAGDSEGPIHITSATTAADCGVVSNTAFVASDDGPGGSSTATVTVSCGALQITKTAKHADDDPETGSLPNLAATFTVTDSAGDEHVIATDATTGIGCADGVAIGLTESIVESDVAGYAEPTIANVEVASGACAVAGVTNVNVVNTPLTDITWSVDSLHPGGTSTVVTCYDAAGDVIDGYPVTIDGDGDGTGTLPDLFPTDPLVTTVSCDFNVDP